MLGLFHGRDVMWGAKDSEASPGEALPLSASLTPCVDGCAFVFLV